MGRPTIKDVAQMAGYSIATVSLVLNNKKVSIPAPTREKVWQAVRELDYRPNSLAVSMVTKRSRVLGLIMPDSSNAFFADVSKSIEKAARRAGYGVIYGNSNNHRMRDLEYVKMFADRQVDGIIFSRSTPSQGYNEESAIQYLQKSGIPFVVLDRRLDQHSNVRSVCINNRLGGYIATRHLLSLGHTHIGAYTGPSKVSSSSERLEGYRQALEEAGIAYNPQLVFEGDFQLGTEGQAMVQFLNQRVTAVFCFNDMMACGLYRELQRVGLSVPRDLSIVGFDNIIYGEIMQPALTTVAIDVEKMGKSAVTVLLEELEHTKLNDGDANDIVLEPWLLVRESTQALRKPL